jgi:hypothetical protein
MTKSSQKPANLILVVLGCIFTSINNVLLSVLWDYSESNVLDCALKHAWPIKSTPGDCCILPRSPWTSVSFVLEFVVF